MPMYGIIYFTKVLHNRHSAYTELFFVGSILAKYNPMRLLPLSRANLLIPFQFKLYNFLSMSLCGGEIFIFRNFKQLGCQLLQHMSKAYSRIGFHGNFDFRSLSIGGGLV